MVLVCYLDDSGTGIESPIVTLSGFVGTLDSWSAFEREAKPVLDAANVTYVRGRDIFSSKGEYKDPKWTVERKLDLIRSLNEKLAPRLGLGLSFGTLKEPFKERSKGRTRIQSPFGFCFEMLFHGLLAHKGFQNVVQKDGVTLSFVIEEGNANNAEIFQRYQRLKRDHGDKVPFFAGMAFAQKNSSIALQMADLLAFFSRRHSEAIESNGREQVPMNHYLEALIKDVTCIGRVSTDFYYSDDPK